MTYGSSDMECNTQNFFSLSFWTVFCPFTPLKTQKSKFEKLKNRLKILSFYTCTINDNHMIYGSWDMERDGQNFLSFWTILCTFIPPNNRKNQNFEKMEKPLGDIILLHMCTINDNHMMYGSWDMERKWQNILSFWTVFCPFTLLTTQKIKILKNWKNFLEIPSFYTSVPKIMIKYHTVP